VPKNLKRGNREAKKPRQPKAKIVAATSTFAAARTPVAPPTAKKD
jgi:hypothetical protein